MGKIIAEINEKTEGFKGLKVPVEVIVDRDTKGFEISVGSPPVSALIKKEIGVEKGAKTKEEKAGDIEMKKVVEIAKSKKDYSLGKELKDITKEVLGTCLSIGVTVEGKDPREVIKEINDGKHDSLFG